MTDTACDLFTPTVEPDPVAPVQPPPAGTPGARDAVAAGCRCPRWLNAYGAGLRTAPGVVAEGQHLAHPECRLHWLAPADDTAPEREG